MLRRAWWLSVIGLLMLAPWLWVGTATSSAEIIKAPATAFKLPSGDVVPGVITTGHEGDLWFTEQYEEKVGRITPSGEVTEFALPKGSQPYGLAPGPEGDLWSTVRNKLEPESGQQGEGRIDRITPSGGITEFFLAGEPSSGAITAGPEGDMWFTVQGAEIGRITPNGAITEFPIPDGHSATSITAGPEGKIWFGQSGEVGSMTPSGAVTESSSPGEKPGITVGPEGDIWFTDRIFTPPTGEQEEGQLEARIGHVERNGRIHVFRLVGSPDYPGPISAGPDGDLWFTVLSYGFRGPFGDTIGRITPAGRISLVEPEAGGTIAGFTVGLEGDLWMTSSSSLLYVPVAGAIVRATPPPPEPLMIGIGSFWAALRFHWVRIRLECEGGPPGTGCRGLLRLKVGHEHEPVDLVTRSYSLPWESSRALVLRLDQRAVKLLARTRMLSSQLTATVSGGQGTSRRIALLR